MMRLSDQEIEALVVGGAVLGGGGGGEIDGGRQKIDLALKMGPVGILDIDQLDPDAEMASGVRLSCISGAHHTVGSEGNGKVQGIQRVERNGELANPSASDVVVHGLDGEKLVEVLAHMKSEPVCDPSSLRLAKLPCPDLAGNR